MQGNHLEGTFNATVEQLIDGKLLISIRNLIGPDNLIFGTNLSRKSLKVNLLLHSIYCFATKHNPRAAKSSYRFSV